MSLETVKIKKGKARRLRLGNPHTPPTNDEYREGYDKINWHGGEITFNKEYEDGTEEQPVT
jgi:hypothetical protein